MTDMQDTPGRSAKTTEFGKAWEDWADDVLGETDFDAELGKRLAKDARRVANGELSPETFRDRHHAAIVDAFGTDERQLGPTETEADGKSTMEHQSSQPGIPDLDTDSSRRKLLGALGGVMAAGWLASVASSRVRGYTDGPNARESAAVGPNVPGDTEAEDQLGMVIDTERCVACLKCSLACKRENDTDRGMHWMYVFRYREQRFDASDEEWMSRPCQHCSDPSCVYVCPTQARHKRWDDDGIVLTDYDKCVGCKYCMVACPYGVNFLGEAEPTDLSPGFQYDTEGKHGRWVAGPPPEGVMGKCTFCVHRQDSGDPDLEGTTACEDICPADAIHFGDLTDPKSDPRTHLRRKPGSHTFELLDQVGNDPNVIYIGKEPSKDAEPIPGPITYDERGMEIRGNYPWLDGGEH